MATIADYSKAYHAAAAKGDTAGMQAANSAANAIRASQGQAAQNASQHISNVTSSNNSNSGGGNSGNSGGRVLQVGADGRAPAGAKIGDTIQTAGGNFTITGGTPGNWQTRQDTTTKPPTSSVSGVQAENAQQQALLDKMNANSLAWHSTAPGSQERAALEAQNQNYASQLSGFGLNIAKDANGMWNVQGMASVPTPEEAYEDPNLIGGAMGDMYGLTYNYDDILKILNKATTDSYGMQRQQAQQSENTFYKNMVDTQSTTLDTLRQAQGAAVATGASKGIAAANELSAMLNLQNVSEKEASLLANERTILNTKEQADMSKNASTALDTSNAIKQAIANLDLTKYGYDVQQVIGKLGFLSEIDSSAKTLEGVKFNANANLQGTLAAAQSNSGGGSSGGGGYTSGSSTGYPAAGNPQTGGVAPVDGSSTSLSEWLADPSRPYNDPASKSTFVSNGNGTSNVHYVDADGKDQILPNVLDTDLNKVVSNKNALAVRNDYGAADFAKAAGIVFSKDKKTVYASDYQDRLKTPGTNDYTWSWENLQWVGRLKSGAGDPAEIAKATQLFGTEVKTGTSVSYKGSGELAREGTINWVYNKSTGMWTNNKKETKSMSDMTKFLNKLSTDKRYKIDIK